MNDFRICVTRPLAELQAGNLVTINEDRGILGFVCWVTLPDGETSVSPDIGYLDLWGEYHERTAKDAYTVWLVHPEIGRRCHIETSAASWAET